MSQFVTVSETLRSRSPELVRRMGEVRVATLDSERERVFRFRYSIYVDELGRGVGTVDPLRGSLRDAEDDENETTILYIADADGLLTGTAPSAAGGRAGPPSMCAIDSRWISLRALRGWARRRLDGSCCTLTREAAPAFKRSSARHFSSQRPSMASTLASSSA